MWISEARGNGPLFDFHNLLILEVRRSADFLAFAYSHFCHWIAMPSATDIGSDGVAPCEHSTCGH
jgi:hypothetical protein